MEHGESTNSEITQEATKQKSIATSSVEYLRSPRTETKFTPQGTREWFPHCPDDKKPYEGMKHENLDKAIEFYKEYAKECGFDPRSSSTYKNREGHICLKYYVCCREGFLDAKKQPVTNGTKRRKRSTVRIGCKAKIIWKRNAENGTYIVYRFYEGHTHSMFTPTSRQYLKSSRKMTMVHKNFVSKNALINIGPVKSFRLFKENIGSYDNVGATMQDFRNFHRDLKQHIEGDDGNMLIENFISKRDVFEGFYFDYALDEGFHISHLFWADAICRKNYALFGEMISFDCTYNTNKYSMILAPFTGVDHHRSCVTFGIGLLAKEDAQSFEWLFRTFLNAMGNCEPKYMITDQDLGMKAAIEKVFVETRHRLCMWHITKKVPDKISPELKKDEDFLSKFSKCVWNMEQEPTEFEATWKSLMLEYDLEQNEWFRHMFKIKEHWIPSYFRDLRLGGILRTTSRSESENSFFNNFTNPHLTLVEFYMRFESAMDAQRHNQDKLNTESCYSLPQLATPLPLEKHASQVYTRTLFYKFQNQVCKACYNCGIVDIKRVDNDIVVIENVCVKDFTKEKQYQVVFNTEDLSVTCSCMLFERFGILCKHAICVLTAREVKYIPHQYILDRWTKDATKKPIFDMHGNLLETCKKMNTKSKILGEVWSEIFNSVGLAEGSEDDLEEFLQNLRDFSKKMEEKGTVQMTKAQEMEHFVGPSASSTLNIQNPVQSKNKGKRTRIIGEKEQAIEQSHKPKRNCKACGAYSYHDSRNCPNKKAS